MHLAYIITYGVSRVYLIYWILRVFGSWTGRSAVSAFLDLPLQCRLGTGAIGVANTLWLLTAARKFLKRYLGGKTGKD